MMATWLGNMDVGWTTGHGQEYACSRVTWLGNMNVAG